MKGFRRYFWTTGEPWNSMRTRALPQLLRVLHSVLMCTLRVSTSGVGRALTSMNGERGDESSDESDGKKRGVVFVCWHDLTLMPLHLFRDRDIAVMISHSRSGQIQAAFWNLYGWPTVWGSTRKREGIRALREALRGLRAGQSLAFSPDGPTGPRHRAQPGLIYLSSNAPAILMPMGAAASSYWRLPTWDKYLIPKPFARVHVHIGEPVVIPPNLERETTEEWQTLLDQIIDETSQEAERRLLKQKR